MKIFQKNIRIGDLVEGFEDKDELGVFAYGGKLNVRPRFQREFVYQPKQRNEVVNSVFKGFPLNVMYWVKTEDGAFDLLDGQQRTISICKFWAGEFFVTIDDALRSYDILTPEQRRVFLDYELQIYICEDGSEQERLDWFRIINIAGEKLTDQELLNAVYPGAWIMNAKQRFSRTGCVAYKLGEKYMTGTPIRQDYLETVLKWLATREGLSVEQYMAQHAGDANADREWQYFQEVVAWVERLFPIYRKEMKGVDWGLLFNRFKNESYSASQLEERVARLMEDDDVTNDRGVYEYVLGGEEKCLNIRAFTKSMKRKAYERQKGICPYCAAEHRAKVKYELEEMEADHITPWSKGGATTVENCQLLCRDCNRRKGGR